MQYRPYNKTFNFYWNFSLDLEKAKIFIEERNEYKGGNWVLYTEEDYLKNPEAKVIEEKPKVVYDIDKSPKFFEVSSVVAPYIEGII